MFASASTWLLSIAGVISLSVIVELMLPEGQLNKYIRSIFSFIVMLVIIAPLPSLIGKNVTFPDISISEEYGIQEDYIFQLNIYKTEAIQSEISSDIREAGYENVTVSITSENYSSIFTIKAIYVELGKIVITDKSAHKNILDIEEEILKIVLSHANVEKEVVHFER